MTEQEEDYQQAVLPPQIEARVAVEAGVSQGWERWVGPKGAVLSVERFGVSAPGKVVFEKFGFTVERVMDLARQVLVG